MSTELKSMLNKIAKEDNKREEKEFGIRNPTFESPVLKIDKDKNLRSNNLIRRNPTRQLYQK